MKALLFGIFAGAVLCGASLAQNAAQPSNNDTMPQNQQSPATTRSAQSNSELASQAPRIAPGSVIPVELTKSIDAKKVKAGDQVDARVTQDLKAENGEVVVPKDTQVVGHITEAQIRNKEQKESQVGISFGHAVMKTGEVPLPMSIQAIIASPTSNADNSNANGESATPPAYGSTAGGMGPGNNSGRSAGTGTPSTPTPRPTLPGSESPTSSQTERTDHQPITGNTQGVVGIANLRLSMATNPKEGSIVSSERNNVKLQSGTLMLLRVNP